MTTSTTIMFLIMATTTTTATTNNTCISISTDTSTGICSSTTFTVISASANIEKQDRGEAYKEQYFLKQY